MTEEDWSPKREHGNKNNQGRVKSKGRTHRTGSEGLQPLTTTIIIAGTCEYDALLGKKVFAGVLGIVRWGEYLGGL